MTACILAGWWSPARILQRFSERTSERHRLGGATAQFFLPRLFSGAKTRCRRWLCLLARYLERQAVQLTCPPGNFQDGGDQDPSEPGPPRRFLLFYGRLLGLSSSLYAHCLLEAVSDPRSRPRYRASDRLRVHFSSVWALQRSATVFSLVQECCSVPSLYDLFSVPLFFCVWPDASDLQS